jgi:hypothetical protein
MTVKIGRIVSSEIRTHYFSFPCYMLLYRIYQPVVFFNNFFPVKYRGHGSAVGWGTALQARRSRVRFPMVSLEIFIHVILPAALCSSGRLSLQQKWVPGIYPGGKGGRCVGLTTLPPSCVDCHEIWEPQPPWTLWACNGIALPLPLR